jgi:hypothetical protein
VRDALQTAIEAIRTQLSLTGQAGEHDMVTHLVNISRVVDARTGAERVEVVPLGEVDESMMRGMVETAAEQLSAGD